MGLLTAKITNVREAHEAHYKEQKRTLREEVLAGYISSSAGVHRRHERGFGEAFNRAYGYHLRGWIPTDIKESWLDLGCGQGDLMRLAAKCGFQEVAGIDASEEMLSVCRADGLAVECCDVFEYLARTPGQQWDVVSAFDLLEHFPKEEGLRLLREIRRVLAPWGVCFVKLPNGASPWGCDVTASDLTHEAMYAPSSLAQLAKIAGFNRCDIREVGPFPGSVKGFVRSALWKVLRSVYAAMNAIETGSPGSRIYTRVMLGRLSR